MMDAFDISASGMTANRLRLDVIASNLANINTTRKNDGSRGTYHRRNVIFAPMVSDSGMGGSDFQQAFPLKASSLSVQGSPQLFMGDDGIPTLKAHIGKSVYEGMGVKVVEVRQDAKSPMRVVYDPTHPDADAKGYVAYPNINPVTEMVDMISATRAYEANVDAIQAAKTMSKAAMDI